MAANAVDKLQFLSFLFADLLSITVHFIALRLVRVIMHHNTKILLKSVQMILRYHDIFSIFRMAVGHHVEYLMSTILFAEEV